MSVSATAQLSLVSTTGTQAAPVYQYDISVANTGTTNVGTFWFAWVPGEDFLSSVPSTTASPTGWSNSLTGLDNSTDGTAIEWVATSHPIAAGCSLSGFSFTTTESPTTLAGNAPTHPTTPVLTSFVYSAGPFSDAGFQFIVASPAASKTATTTTLATSTANATAGAPITLTATVTPATPGTTPTGTINFARDGTSFGTGTIDGNGTATFTTSSLPIGTDHITATYSGDGTFSASSSAGLTETIAPPTDTVATTTGITASPTTATAGSAVILTATVTAATPGVVPTGTVKFTQNGTSVGSVVVGNDGTASVSISTLAAGSNAIVAVYGGDGTYASSTSTPVTVLINDAPTVVPNVVESTLPENIVAGVVVRGVVTVSIANASAAVVKGKSTVAIYASMTGNIGTGAILLGQTNKSLNLKVGGSTTAKVRLKIGTDTLPVGEYTLFARVNDPAAKFIDSTAGQAVIAAAPFYALSQTLMNSGLPKAPVPAGARSKIFATLGLTNNGNSTTAGLTTIAMYATSNGVIDGSSIRIAGFDKPLKIRVGKSAKVTVSSAVIPAIPVGQYQIVTKVTDSTRQSTTLSIGLLNITG